MARVRPGYPGQPTRLHRRRKYQRASLAKLNVQHVESQEILPATPRSASLLLSFPFEIISPVFRMVVEDAIAGHILSAPFYNFLDFSKIVNGTRSLRGACVQWHSIVLTMYFGWAASASRFRYRVAVSELPRLKATFPHLQHCILDLSDPNQLVELEQKRALLQRLSAEPGALDFITAVAFEGDPENISPGYSRNLMKSLCEEACSTYRVSLPTYDASIDDIEPAPGCEYRAPEVDGRVIDSLKAQIMALSYYHAQIFREILSHLPRLVYLEVPVYMLPALLIDTYLDPEETTQRQALQHLGINYEEYGAAFQSILQSVRYLHIIALHNPVHGIYRWNRVSQGFRAPVFRDWESHIGVKVGCSLRDRSEANFIKLSKAKHECDVLQRLAYRGSETASRDDDAVMAQVLRGFVPPELREFHFVSSCHLRIDPLLFPLESAWTTLTSLTIDTPRALYDHVDFCIALKEGCFPNLSHLDVTIDGICPTLIEALSQRRVPSQRGGEPIQWRIRTSPQVCSTWMEEKTGLEDPIRSLTFAFLSTFVDKARAAVISNPGSPLANTSFSVETSGVMNNTLARTLSSDSNITNPVRMRTAGQKLILEFAFTPSSTTGYAAHLSDFTFRVSRIHRIPRKTFVRPPSPPAPDNYDSLIPPHLRLPRFGPRPRRDPAPREAAPSQEARPFDGDFIKHTFAPRDDGPEFLAQGVRLERRDFNDPDYKVLVGLVDSDWRLGRLEWGFFDIVQYLVWKEMGMVNPVETEEV